MDNITNLYGSKRPRIWLRREPDEYRKCAIRSVIACWNGQDKQWALANLEALYAGQPVAVHD